MSLRFKTLTSHRAVNEPQQLMRSCQAIKTCSLLTVLLHIYLLKRDLRLFKYELEMLQYNYLSKWMFISSFFICSAGMWHWILLQEISWQIPWTGKQNKRKDTENMASGLSRKIKQIKCSCYLNAITWLNILLPAKTELLSVISHNSAYHRDENNYKLIWPFSSNRQIGSIQKIPFLKLNRKCKSIKHKQKNWK